MASLIFKVGQLDALFSMQIVLYIVLVWKMTVLFSALNPLGDLVKETTEQDFKNVLLSMLNKISSFLKS
jgi:hypothetical protein